MDNINNLEEFHFEIFGWDVKNPPPKINSKGDFQNSPAGVVLQETVNSGPVKYQSITVANQTTDNINGIDKWQVDEVKNEYFRLYTSDKPGLKQGSMNLILNIPSMEDLTNFICSIVFKAATEDGDDGYIFSVNGNVIDTKPVKNSLSWQTKNYQIDLSLLHEGDNSINVQTSSGSLECQIFIESISISSGVYLKASTLWKSIDNGEITPGGSHTVATQYTSGITSTSAETQSFSESIGLEASASYGVIGTKLSESFTSGHSTTHSISLSKQEEKDYSTTLNAPKDKTTTYQVWQLCLLYESIGTRVIQALSQDEGVIIPRQYPL